MNQQPLLALRNISVRFGGLIAAKDVSLSVEQDQIAAIIGPNGAGKTTVFNCVTGVYTPTSGTIHINSADIREMLTLSVLVRCATVGTLCGVAALLGLNAQTLWDASINQTFIYGHAFDWTRAATAFFRSLRALPTQEAICVLVVGFCVGAAGNFVMWLRGRHSPYSTIKKGVTRTFQNIRLFKSMSAVENVMVGMHTQTSLSALATILRTARFKRVQAERRAQAEKLLTFVGLNDCADQPATSLPYGYQRKLEIARALASNPSLLLLDEPAAGMNPSEMDDLADLIARVRERGIAVLLIEHHMKLVMGISDHVTVLEYGQKISEGAPEVVQRDPKVIAAYLGDSHEPV